MKPAGRVGGLGYVHRSDRPTDRRLGTTFYDGTDFLKCDPCCVGVTRSSRIENILTRIWQQRLASLRHDVTHPLSWLCDNLHIGWPMLPTWFGVATRGPLATAVVMCELRRWYEKFLILSLSAYQKAMASSKNFPCLGYDTWVWDHKTNLGWYSWQHALPAKSDAIWRKSDYKKSTEFTFGLFARRYRTYGQVE